MHICICFILDIHDNNRNVYIPMLFLQLITFFYIIAAFRCVFVAY